MKKIVAACLSAVIMLCALSFGADASFSDISDPGTARDAAVLEQLGVINGIGGGLFDPEGTLTRAQFCKMTVYILNKQGEAAQYAASSVFTDVRGSHWASGYIHYCVKNGIVLGIGDGSFAPDRPIYFPEAVTVLMRVLGYKDTDFVLPWPEGYLAQAASIGLSNGLESLGKASVITRAQAVKLFKNLLLCEDVNGSEFASRVFGGLSDNAVILVVNGNRVTAMVDGLIKEYTAACTFDSSIVGTSCRFITDNRGRIKAALTTDELKGTSVTVEEAKYTYITDTRGTRHYVDEDTSVVIDGSYADYSTAWLSVRPGALMTVYTDEFGRNVIITINSKSSPGSEAVVCETQPANIATLASLFGLDPNGSYAIIKNGTYSDISNVRQYDVVTFDTISKTFYVSDFRLSGYYESAWPNYETPTKITVLGKEFDVVGPAREQICNFGKSSRVTLLFTDDLRVAGVYSAVALYSAPIAFAEDVTEDFAIVTFPSGLTISLPATADYSGLSGSLVRVGSSEPGRLTLSGLEFIRPNETLNVGARTLGEVQLSTECAVYDSIGGKCITQIHLSDIYTARVTDVLHAEYDSAGRVSLLVLNNASGMCYEYGKIKCEVLPYAWVDGTVTEKEHIGVENSSYSGNMYPSNITSTYLSGTFAGIAVHNGAVIQVVYLEERTCSRSDFSGGYVNIDGVLYPVSSCVQCYIRDTGKWVGTLDEARTASNTIKVYFDKTPETGGQVRIVAAW